MNKILLLSALLVFACSSEEDAQILPENYTIGGKWLYEVGLNTMYIFESGIRYTYYCVEGDCQAQYESFEAGDGNHIPGTNNYTFEDGILTIDLNFGNELVAPLTFDCDGDRVLVQSQNPYYLYRLGSTCN